ncbi:hypothetical protein [Thermococcus sp. Bubb.Bath]|uniref:hypothetical protein n=1 Tax=Thermococcus sp. Bubb.Bath TaxID=1638242 RepID=UPI00143B12BD|nr:hypothetical protein [Thermococcus sp. Bubb.Bath]NJF24143.1 hypothetical protein [Thermococcus sp. Bubb.Bath]
MKRGMLLLPALLIISGVLFYHPVSANHRMDYRINTTAVCGNFTIKGGWSDIGGLQTVLEGTCIIEFPNPANTSIKDKFHVFNIASPGYWNNVEGIISVTPEEIEYPRGWIAPGEPVKIRVHFERRGIRPIDALRIVRLGFFRWRTNIDWEVNRTAPKGLPLWFSINVGGTGRITPDWPSILLMLSVYFMWTIITLVGALLIWLMRKRKNDEGTILGAGLALGYSYIISYFSVFFTLSPTQSLLLLALLSLMLLSIWTSLVNRTTPKKPEKTTKLLGNLALTFVALAVATALAVSYLERSSAMAFGLLVFIVLFELLFIRAIEKSVGEIEKKGKIPRVKTRFLVVTVLVMIYPVIATSILAKRLYIEGSSILIGTITVILGFSVERIAKREKKISLKN